MVAGPYSVNENDPAPGHDLTALTCDDSNSTGNVGTRTASVSLQAGETATCTFQNTERGTIVIKKDAVPDSGTDFTYTDDIPGCTVGPLDDDLDNTNPSQTTCTNVVPGPYSVTDNDPAPGHDLTALTCDDSNSTGNVGTRTASISLHAGETVTCTFHTLSLRDALPN